MQNPIYLDYNATTPIDPAVKDVMQPFLDQYFGNPSSSHLYGVQTKKAVEMARRQIAELINCFPDEVIFTSGGTEANNYAIKGIAYQIRHKGNHIITSQIEHPAVTEVCVFLESQGFSVTWLPVNEWGVVDAADVEKAIMPGTILISIMHANNETGTIQPVEQIGALAQKHGVVFHCDAAQSAGKIPIDVKQMGVNLLSLAGHKFYAPKGVGALYIKRGLQLQKLMHGANHEQNLRAGTENVLEIAGLGKAAEIALRDFEQNTRTMKSTRDLLFGLLQEGLPQIKLNGHPDLRLPNTLNISFPNMEANVLLDELSGIAASAGAACHTDSVDISPVLMAMKIPVDFAKGTIRFSTGKKTTEQEVRTAAQMIIEAVNRLMPDSMSVPSDDIPETGEIKLTRYTQGLGCACKIRPQYLEKVLQDMPPVFDPNVLVGTATSDDAAVYRLNDTMALVQTLDFFTPIVDDPYSFGAIAAANALSDIYAMGAKPLFALNIVGFPSNRLPMQVLKDILRGASDKATEAGISILGGHSVDDPEPKFGMVVSGLVDPNKILTNGGAKPGDVLILTKPIGTGIISTSVKRNLASNEVARAALDVMIALNANAASIMQNYPVHACTDVTGFGLLGHLNEMIAASDASCQINVSKVPVIEGVYELAMAGAIPGGSRNNLSFVNDHVAWADGISEVQKLILADAQTSGGLLMAMDREFAEKYITELASQYNQQAWRIGEIVPRGKKRIEIYG